MTQSTIEVEGLPEGWELEGVSITPSRTKDINDCWRSASVKLRRIQPRRIVLEDTGELRQPQEGEYVENNGNYCLCRKPERWGNEHKIWREIKE